MHLNPLLISFTFQEAARLRDLLQMQSFDAEAGVLSANNEFYAAFRQLQPACFDVESLWIPLPMFALSSSKIFGPFEIIFYSKWFQHAFFGLFLLLFNSHSRLQSQHTPALFSEHGEGWQCGADDEDLASQSQDLLRSPWEATTEWLLGWEPCCSHKKALQHWYDIAFEIYICHIIIFYSYAMEFTSSYTIVFWINTDAVLYVINDITGLLWCYMILYDVNCWFMMLYSCTWYCVYMTVWICIYPINLYRAVPLKDCWTVLHI